MSPIGPVRAWVGIAFAVTCVAGSSYGLAQQTVRTAADDPQVQLAEDTARRLQAGGSPGTEVSASPVEIDSSLAPWLMIYGRDGRLLASNAELDGTAVEYPASAVSSVVAGGQKHLTWAPRPSARQATVIVGYSSGWVIAGRSLRAVEKRTASLLLLALAGWSIALAGSALVLLGLPLPTGRRRRDSPPPQQ